MNVPAQIYAIYPLDGEGNIAGVYVGMTSDIQTRIYQHTIPKTNDVQDEFHSLMRENGFYFQVLDVVKELKDRHLEADWINFFELQDIKLFNKAKTKGYKLPRCKSPGGNAQNLIREWNRNLTKFFVPHWGGAGVIWQVKTSPTF